MPCRPEKLLSVTADNNGLKVRVRIEIMRNGVLSDEETDRLRAAIAGGVMMALQNAPYLHAPVALQRVRNL